VQNRSKPAFSRGAATALTVIALLCACGGGGSGGNSGGINATNLGRDNPGLAPVVTVSPENTADGWATSAPGAEGIDTAALLAGMNAIRDGQYPGVDSIVVVRNSRLVAEGYFNGFGRETLHDLRSASKSITSALAGIAVAQGLFTVDDPIAQHVPQFEQYANMDDRKRSITVLNLLNMSSGLDCNDWVPASPGNEERMYESADWIKFILDLRMANAPGGRSSYCTGGVVVLGSIVATRSGMTLDGFATTYLFNPLGIANVVWRRSPDGRATGGGMMRLRPRDAAKFGTLLVNGGLWNGTRVVPAAWVEVSKIQANTLGSDGYGYLWWKRSFQVRGAYQESFFAWGNGGNFIFCFPAEQLVVAFTASNYNLPSGDTPFRILADRVLPAVN
jgi:CubicO group peptidase (beta-lactamase class C family)